MIAPFGPEFLDGIVRDLSPFADIGTDPPEIEQSAENKLVRFVRQGEPTALTVGADGSIIESFRNTTRKYSSFKALLASDRFGHLRDWSTKQNAYLSQDAIGVNDPIDVQGVLNGGIQTADVAAVDELLCAPQQADSTRVLLIDGPAGIGKTQFITSLAARPVSRYAIDRHPLILHVQSRGRTLSYLYDLVAFSLQRLRLEVTFDQVPVLAKHGLITIAIDGFDELADPDGYDLAWSQVSDLVQLLRGTGSLILAGRETFIGRDRVLKDIASLRDGVDEVSALTLQPPTKTTAIRWLQRRGWSDDQLNSVEGFLEPSSLALRPFFLNTLAGPDVAERIAQTASTSVLSILMEAMLDREVGKFGDAVERELSGSERSAFSSRLCAKSQEIWPRTVLRQLAIPPFRG